MNTIFTATSKLHKTGSGRNNKKKSSMLTEPPPQANFTLTLTKKTHRQKTTCFLNSISSQYTLKANPYHSDLGYTAHKKRRFLQTVNNIYKYMNMYSTVEIYTHPANHIKWVKLKSMASFVSHSKSTTQYSILLCSIQLQLET